MKIIHSSEKGQIVVILALVLVGLLGFTALAIDGGMIFADQRYLQSSADAASLAGGGAAAVVVEDLDMSLPEWDCTKLNDLSSPNSSFSKAYAAAYEKAALNGFDVENDSSLGDVNVTCFPAEKYLEVDVTLTKVTNTSFVHLFNNGEMRTTAFSKTRVVPRTLAGNGASIVSLSLDCGNKKGGVWFSGNNDTVLEGGGVYSNSCVDRNSGSATVAFENGAGVTYHAGSYVAGITPPPVPVIDPDVHPLTNNPLPSPGDRCADLPNRGDAKFNTGTGETISYGNYGDWDFMVPVKLNPGLYCITGTVSMNASAYVYGTGVTIYYTGTKLTLNGGADTALEAPDWEPDNLFKVENYAEEDLLLYIPPGVVADVTINGDSNNTFSGTMYMPDSLVKINGNSTSGESTIMQVSVIGYWITITGNSDFSVKYNANKETGWPAYIQLQK